LVSGVQSAEAARRNGFKTAADSLPHRSEHMIRM